MTDWSFIIPGQPPSVNHMYVLARTKAGRPYQAKAPGVEAYQIVVSALCRQARPSLWVPNIQIPVRYAFHVKRDIDCDNAMKAINDAIAIALEVNDRAFLPCVSEKTTKNKDPYVQIWIG